MVGHRNASYAWAAASDTSPAISQRGDGLAGSLGEGGGEGVARGRPSDVTVVFLHGWALAQHSYEKALEGVAALGCEVYAPAMPGFGSTAPLPRRSLSLGGYAEWVAEFLTVVGLDRPILAVGHSFGGAVAVRLAHDSDGSVGSLVLVDSVGSRAWRPYGTSARPMAERPLWDWGARLPSDLYVARGALRLMSAVMEDAVANLVGHPLALWRAGLLARSADVVSELAELHRRGLPVSVLWGDRDSLLPRACFDELCTAAGSQGELVPGRHSWLLADPDAFAVAMRAPVEAFPRAGAH